MSQQPYVPVGPEPERVVTRETEPAPDSTVRRVLGEYIVDRERPWSRWGAVVAGVFVAAAATILLSLLGLGLGVSITNPLAPSASGLGIGTAIWWGVQSLLTVFLGGYVAARLWGSAHRREGVMLGGLTWAVSLVALVWMLGSVASLAVRGAAGAAGAAGSMRAQPPAGSMEIAPEDLETGKRAAAGSIWYLFLVSAGALLTGVGGGALGAKAAKGTFGSRREAGA